jgi:hypothetical protein
MSDITTGSAALIEVAEFIEANPHLYDQGTWGDETDCGTVACIAGHLALPYCPEDLQGMEVTQWLHDNAHRAALHRLGWGYDSGLFNPDVRLPNRMGETLVECLSRLATGVDGSDEEGYDWEGYDENGYDRYGYDENGKHKNDR